MLSISPRVIRLPMRGTVSVPMPTDAKLNQHEERIYSGAVLRHRLALARRLSVNPDDMAANEH